MLTRTAIALSATVLLGTASAALATTKHPVHHHHVTVVSRDVPTEAYGAGYGGDVFGSRPTASQVREPAEITIQDKFFDENN